MKYSPNLKFQFASVVNRSIYCKDVNMEKLFFVFRQFYVNQILVDKYEVVDHEIQQLCHMLFNEYVHEF